MELLSITLKNLIFHHGFHHVTLGAYAEKNLIFHHGFHHVTFCAYAEVSPVS
jgi:hypothetical protein